MFPGFTMSLRRVNGPQPEQILIPWLPGEKTLDSWFLRVRPGADLMNSGPVPQKICLTEGLKQPCRQIWKSGGFGLHFH